MARSGSRISSVVLASQSGRMPDMRVATVVCGLGVDMAWPLPKRQWRRALETADSTGLQRSDKGGALKSAALPPRSTYPSADEGWQIRRAPHALPGGTGDLTRAAEDHVQGHPDDDQ